MTSWANPLFIVSEDPTAISRAFADEARKTPVRLDEATGMWNVLCRQDVLAALRKPETFSTRPYKAGVLHPSLTTLEGEERERMKRIVTQVLSPRALQVYEDDIIVPAIRRILDELDGAQVVDLVPRFAMRVSTEVISGLFSMSREHYEKNDALLKAIMRTFVKPFDPVTMAEGRAAHQALREGVRSILDREMQSPQPNLLGNFVRDAKAEGVFDPTTCENIIVSLIVAGYDTTIWMVATAVSALLLNPPVIERVRSEPALLAPAIEESMRWACPSTGAIRSVECDVEVSGTPIPAGSVVNLSYHSANYDAEAFPRPEIFDVARNPSHLAFSSGAHFCVGAALARLEARVGISMLLDRFPSIRLDADRRPVFSVGVHGSPMFGPDTLHVRLD